LWLGVDRVQVDSEEEVVVGALAVFEGVHLARLAAVD